MDNKPRADELEYLRWFASVVDFGPADADVQRAYQKYFEDGMGKLVPEGWRIADDD